MQNAAIAADPPALGEVGSAMLVEPEKNTPFERVYRGILRRLFEGQLEPGQRLVEPEMMREFEVGRGTIREVLNRLAAAGVVTIVRHRGASIRQLTRREVYDILELVELMLGLSARHCAKSMAGGGDAQALIEALETLSESAEAGDLTRFLQARERYYRVLVQLGGNRELQRIFPSAQVHIMRAQLRQFGHAPEGIAFTDYATITRAVLSGSPPTAEAAARTHVRNFKRGLSRLPDRAFKPI